MAEVGKAPADDHIHPGGWALIITPTADGRIHTYGPGLNDEQALAFLIDVVKGYRRDLGHTKVLVIECLE